MSFSSAIITKFDMVEAHGEHFVDVRRRRHQSNADGDIKRSLETLVLQSFIARYGQGRAMLSQDLRFRRVKILAYETMPAYLSA